MFGYFRTRRKFFSRKFHQANIEFIASRYNFLVNEIDLNSYAKPTFLRHQEIVLDFFAFTRFDDAAKGFIKQEIASMVTSQLRFKLILLEVIEILTKKKVEIPSYYLLANLIVSQINLHKREMMESIEANFSQRCPVGKLVAMEINLCIEQ
ncbi:MAG: DUF4158 domain-containing protein [Acidobacteriota bacterium]